MVKQTEYAIVRIRGEAGHSLSELAVVFFALDFFHREMTLISRLLELMESSFDRRSSYNLAKGLLQEPPESPSAKSLQQHLVFHAASFSSPGIWDFLGKLNPLEVLREFLNDRHRRRQDREYREPAEKRKLELENFVLENNVIQQRLDMLRKAGFSDGDLRLLTSRLLLPLERLELAGAAGILGEAEIIPIEITRSVEEEPAIEEDMTSEAPEAVLWEEVEAMDDDTVEGELMEEDEREMGA